MCYNVIGKLFSDRLFTEGRCENEHNRAVIQNDTYRIIKTTL